MRLGVVSVNGRRELVDVRDDGLTPVGFPGDVSDLLATRSGVISGLVQRPTLQRNEHPLELPLRPGKIVAIGLNYRDHVLESGVEVPDRPLVFAKFPSSAIGPGDPIVIDESLTERVDWEVELAVVIGRRMRNVDEASALDYVFGYTVANDVSARDVQFADGQWVRGKSFDSFCPLGPVVVTCDEVEDPQAVRLRTSVNGEVVQDSATSEMIFGVRQLLAFCSRAFTLDPGDVLLSGTPWGCGEFMTPRRSLAHGDVVEVEAEGVGLLRNPVVAASSLQTA